MISLIVSLCGGSTPQRMTEENKSHAAQYMDMVHLVSKVHNVPVWVLAGVAFNESHFKETDGNRDIKGITQISCRTWSRFLKNRFIIKSCEDLKRPSIAIESTAVILSYIKGQKQYATWPRALTAYRKGHLRDGIYDGYVSRVYCFGGILALYSRYIKHYRLGNLSLKEE